MADDISGDDTPGDDTPGDDTPGDDLPGDDTTVHEAEVREPGWLPDPYGRYQERWWDGRGFTGQTRTDGEELEDPLGTTASIPFATPASALPGGSGSTIARFTTQLGPDARRRPDPRLTLTLAGIGGAVGAAGFAALVVGDDATRVRGVIAGVVLLVAAVSVRLFVRKPEELMAAAVSAGAVGILVAVGATMAEVNSFTWPALVMALAFTTAWVLPGLRGRPLMLGLAAAFLIAGLVSATAEVADWGNDGITFEECDRIYEEDGFEAMPEECFTTDFESDATDPFSLLLDNDVTAEGVVALLCGATVMAAVFVLDRRRYQGIATSLLPVGVIAILVGTALLTSDFGDIGAALIVTSAGVAICMVGSSGLRRATTWWGAYITSAGFVALAASVVEPSSTLDAGTMLLIAGALLIVVPFAVAGMLRNSTRV